MRKTTGRSGAGVNNRGCIANDSGDAVVEATILFPVMTMVFAALVLIAIYLPAQAVLEHSTQTAATALATEISDTWLLSYIEGEDDFTYTWVSDIDSLSNVYVKLFENHSDYIADKGERLTQAAESRSISSKAGDLTVVCSIKNMFIYKEIIVEASREYKMPVNLSIIGFPEVLTISASSTAVVQNGDEFVRNMDIAAQFAGYLAEKFGLTDIGKSIGDFGGRIKELLGW